MRVWFVAQVFPPKSSIGAERAKKFVRHLRALDCTVTVFSVKDLSGAPYPNFAGAKIRRSAVLYPKYFWEASSANKKEQLWLQIPRILTAILGDFGWAWMRGLKRDLDLALEDEGRPDVVIATGSPFLSFLTVASFCRMNSIPLVLDYRDAWARNPHLTFNNFLRRHLLLRLEAHVNRQADAILTVSHATAQALNTTKSPLVIYNLPDAGYVDEILALAAKEGRFTRRSRERLTISYSGTLYPGRDLDPICAAIAQLSPSERENLVIYYCGQSSKRAEASFRAYGVEQCLTSLGKLPKMDAVNVVLSSDIALSVIASHSAQDDDALRGVMTTKIFDYLILGKEVLNIVPPGFEFRTFAHRMGIKGVHNFSPNDVPGIAGYLRDRLQPSLTDKTEFRSGDTIGRMVASWQEQMAAFDSLLQRLVHESAPRNR